MADKKKTPSEGVRWYRHQGGWWIDWNELYRPGYHPGYDRPYQAQSPVGNPRAY